MDNPSLDTLKDIRNMMERSSRFISLSGWSGVAAGICALAGAWLASRELGRFGAEHLLVTVQAGGDPGDLARLRMRLVLIGLGVLFAALCLATLFTWLRSRKVGVRIWGKAAQRLLWNTSLPMLTGGILVCRLTELGLAGLVAPTCLLFYGVALVAGSKYTLGEVRYLGYAEILLGAINCWAPGYGLYFWAAGFGVLHILYGLWMWGRYEAKPSAS